MGFWCAAYNCSNRAKKGSGISFHKFPIHNPQLLAKWLAAVKRDKFVPAYHHKLCSYHFTQSCFWKSNGRRILKDDAVPTIFNFTSHLKKIEKPPQRILESKVEPDSSNVNDIPESYSFMNIADEHNYSVSSNEAVQKMKSVLNRKDLIIQSLKNKNLHYERICRRQDCLLNKLKSAKSNLKEKVLINEHKLRVVSHKFSDVMLDLISRASGEQSGEYSEILKKFAITMHLYSPTAYDFLRQSVNELLPPVDIVRKWQSSISASGNSTEETHMALDEHMSLLEQTETTIT